MLNQTIVVRRGVFRAFIEEHLLMQGFSGSKEELENIIDTYEQVENEFVQGSIEEDGN